MSMTPWVQADGAPPRPRTARNRVNAEKQVILMERIDKLPESPYNNFVIFIRFK